MEEDACEAVRRGALQSITWQRALLAFAALLLFAIAAKLCGNMLRRALARRGNEGGAPFALSKLLTYALGVAGAIAALGLLGIPLASLLLTSSALLVGLGLSMQHVARDFVSGVIILVEQSIRKNDFVTFGETVGTVQEIGLRSTQLLTRDGTVLFVPNHLLTSTEVSNHSSPHERERMIIELPVAFRENVEAVREALLSVARGDRQILVDPAPVVHFAAITDSHFQLMLIVWVAEPVATLNVASELRFCIVRELAKRGIQLPTPELEVHTGAARDGQISRME